MTLKKNLLFLPVLSLVVINNNNYANAATKKVDGLKKTSFFDRFYVKGNAYLGYNYQKIINNLSFANSVGSSIDSDYKNSAILSLPTIGFGNNFYFKINNRFHAFLGVDATIKIPIKRSSVQGSFNFSGDKYRVEKNEFIYDDIVKKGNFIDEFNFHEYAKLNAKLGMKIVLHKNFSIEPYALAGINLARIGVNAKYSYKLEYDRYSKILGFMGHENNYSEISSNSFKKNGLDIGTVFGAGLNFVFNERFVIGVEYYRSCNKINDVLEQNNTDPIKIKRKLSIDNVMVKFGVQFM